MSDDGEKSLPEIQRDGFAATLRQEREKARISLRELAKRAGISKSSLSQFEAGKGNPSLESLWALAQALNIRVSELIDPPARASKLVRASERADIQADAADYAVTLLSAAPAGARRDIYRAAFDPGTVKHSEPHSPGTVEHIILLTGRARIGEEGNMVELLPGDYLTFAADCAHAYEALEPGTTGLIIMEYD